MVEADAVAARVRAAQMQILYDDPVVYEWQHIATKALAEAFGATGYRADSAEELAGKIRLGFTQQGPVVIEMPLGETGFPWKYLLLPRVRSNARLTPATPDKGAG